MSTVPQQNAQRPAHRQTLQERVREVMDHQGWNQARLAQELGISRAVVSQLFTTLANSSVVSPAWEAMINCSNPF